MVLLRLFAAALSCVVVLSLGGCVSYQANVRSDGSAPSGRFALNDQRPVQQTVSENVSLSITNCAYGIYQLGDPDIVPSRVTLLHAALERELGDRLAGKTVELVNYTVHWNKALSTRQGAAALQGGGIVPSLMNDQSVRGCGNEDLKGGYTAAESSSTIGPLVVVIDLRVDGRSYHARVVETPGPEVKGLPKDMASAWNAFVSDAIEHATAQLLDDLRRRLPAN